MSLLARHASYLQGLRQVVQKRHDLTPQQRYQRALRQVVGAALVVGYTAGWAWRGSVERQRRFSSAASSRRSGG